ncbi:hypothetical protein ACJJTC_010392 [Scirpophaga incertulas]
MKTETFAKLFFTISCTGLFMYTVLAFYTLHNAHSTLFDIEIQDTPLSKTKTVEYSYPQTDNELKYILIWTTPEFNENPLGEGQEPFVKQNCIYSNCYLSTDKHLLKRYQRDFDVVIMDIGVLRLSRWKSILPKKRTPFQKFIFHSMKSSDESPICNIKADGFFNWTWTYRIDSDILTPFIEVNDLEGNIIAPRRNVKWAANTKQLSVGDLKKLYKKKKAVAWIPDSCKIKTDRTHFVKSLQKALRDRSLDLDIFGCYMGTIYNCPEGGCMQAIENDYYFYLVHEESLSEDYVTTEVLKAYHHNTVPIVRSGADLKFFLPAGSYIDASADHNKGICDLCAKINDKIKFNTPTSYDQFRKWWYNDLKDKCYPKGAEEMEEVLSYLRPNRSLKGY